MADKELFGNTEQLKLDTISRAAALKTAEWAYRACEDDLSYYHDLLVAALMDLTPAQPGWIPCKERLPKEKDAGILKKLGTEKMSEYVLATVEVKGERMTVTACTYDGKWHWNMKYAFPDYKVVAWMPLPTAYQGGGKE